jgi:hypothetical protein
MIVHVCAFCQKALSPQGEPRIHVGEHGRLHCIIPCAQVAASREILPGRHDLLKPLPGRHDLQATNGLFRLNAFDRFDMSDRCWQDKPKFASFSFLVEHHAPHNVVRPLSQSVRNSDGKFERTEQFHLTLGIEPRDSSQ